MTHKMNLVKDKVLNLNIPGHESIKEYLKRYL